VVVFVGVRAKTPDECGIDLDDVGLDAAEVGEGRIIGAEIIKGETHAPVPQVFEHRAG
jgi:hypothetical protein